MGNRYIDFFYFFIFKRRFFHNIIRNTRVVQTCRSWCGRCGCGTGRVRWPSSWASSSLSAITWCRGHSGWVAMFCVGHGTCCSPWQTVAVTVTDRTGKRATGRRAGAAAASTLMVWSAAGRVSATFETRYIFFLMTGKVNEIIDYIILSL